MSQTQKQNNSKRQYYDPKIEQNFTKFSTNVSLTQYRPSQSKPQQNKFATKQTPNAQKPQSLTPKIEPNPNPNLSQPKLPHPLSQPQPQPQPHQSKKNEKNSAMNKEIQQNFTNYFEMRHQSNNTHNLNIEKERKQKEEEEILKIKEQEWVDKQNQTIRERIVLNQELQMMEQRRKRQIEQLKQEKKVQEENKLEEEKLEKMLKEKHQQIERQKQRQKRGQLQQFLAHERQRTTEQPTVVILQPQYNKPQLKIIEEAITPTDKSIAENISKSIQFQQTPPTNLETPDPNQSNIRHKIHTVGTWLLVVRDYYRKSKLQIKESESYKKIQQNCQSLNKQIFGPLSVFYRQVPLALTQFKAQLISGYSLNSRILVTGAVSIGLGALSLGLYKKGLLFSIYPVIRNTLVSYAMFAYFLTPEIYFPLISKQFIPAEKVQVQTAPKNQK